jgi:hypothetical protein
MTPDLSHSARGMNVLAVNRVQSTSDEKHPDQGFAATLSELGQGSSADIIDQQLASGRKVQYTFAIIVGPADFRGRLRRIRWSRGRKDLEGMESVASSLTNLGLFAPLERIARQLFSTWRSKLQRARLRRALLLSIVVVSRRAVVTACPHAALLESGARNRRDRGRSCPVSRIVPFRHGRRGDRA